MDADNPRLKPGGRKKEMDKKKIAVLFGGQSSEHVVSCMSAANVI